jgi:FK506-binding nuclear protein
LTGNYVVPDEEIENSEDDEDYSDDELENALAGYDANGMSDEEEYSEEDELDNLEDPRIMEVDSEEEAPKLIEQKPAKKGKNKRTADDSEDETAKDILEKVLKTEEAATNGEKKLSKKQLKKLKNNAGEAAAAPKVEEKATDKKSKKESKKEAATPETNGSGKKVQFAEKLEQGPTPTKADNKKADSKKDDKKEPKTRVVSGVTIDERKTGKGPAAKKGDKISMRYIGKLKDGKVFDCKYLSSLQCMTTTDSAIQPTPKASHSSSSSVSVKSSKAGTSASPA